MNDATPTTILAGTVLSMTDRGVLRDQAITVADGRITRVAPRAEHEITGPVVDWRDRTILPGLADCHVHVEDRADMLGYLAHGVTLVRNMRGKPWHLDWRRRVAEGAELGPYLVTSTAMADGRGAPGTTVWPDSAQITDRASAHAAVHRWAGLGYQQVKAYQWLSAEALEGLGEACRDTGLPLVGHCPQELTVHQAIDRGQTGFEHLNNYEYGSLRPAAQERLDAFFAQGFSYGRGRNRFSPEAAKAASDIDEHKIAALAQRMAAENITSCPTLIVLDRLLGHRDFSDPRLRLTDPVLARTWRSENDFRIMALTPDELQGTADLFHERSRRVLAALRDAGAPVLVGTDTHNAFVFHGSSLVEELELMTGAGYTSAELVRLATRGAADYFGLTDRGRVDAGFVADLVAVTGDPLASVTALKDPAAVVVGGTVLERPRLDALLDEVETLVHAEPDRARLRPVPSGERLVGEYERTSFGRTDAATRISSHSDGGATTWREQIATRHGVETRTTVIDASGYLVSADIERRRAEGADVATVRRDGDRYAVHWSTLDGAELDAEVPAPLLPGVDLGVAALLAAARLAPDQGRWPVLSLGAGLANALPPVPGTLERDGDELVQRTTDAIVRIAGDVAGEYTVQAPMTQLVHRRAFRP
ncbi:amidohydrolase family protein [Jiangella muralis]|uniref:amidohydrolase family protein n=1 Tax=Jiangella muralis TaxID=702383 RepID=UPI00069D7AE2|nr:amidohydrolase family protein [Jiangella muralis]